MVVITFYTDSDYRTLADKMARSAARVGLRVHAYDMSEELRGANWCQRLYAKAVLVERAMDRFDEDVLWCDADVTWFRHPTMLFNVPPECDIACYVEDNRYLWGGVMWVRNSPGGREMMRTWTRENQAIPNGLDDHNAYQIFMREGMGKRIYHLPPTYCWTEEIHRRKWPDAEPILQHDLIVTMGDKKTRAQAVERPWGS